MSLRPTVSKDKSRPVLVKRVFSVDDDANEVQNDIRYFENLADGVKIVLPGSENNIQDSAALSTGGNVAVPVPQGVRDEALVPVDSLRSLSTPDLMESITNLQQKLVTPRINGVAAHGNVGSPRFIIHDHTHTHPGDKKSATHHDLYIEELPAQRSNSSQALPAGSVAGGNGTSSLTDIPPVDLEASNLGETERLDPDNASRASSIESYTLRERQDAINETHPFGIRIWKPALYKKKRSVEKAADEDIHETKLKKITWAVKATNWIWVATCGLFLFTVFASASITVLIAGLFTKSARDYSRLMLRLARYLLYPFGKVVYLIQDKQYLEEDRDEGISVQQFYNWVTSYKSRLFFHESQTRPTESEALGNNMHHTSYGSIQKVVGEQTNTESSNPMLDNNGYTELPHSTSFQNPSNDHQNSAATQRRLFGRGKWSLGRIVFYAIFHIVLQPIVLFLSLLTWLAVFTIPMSNILWNLMYHCRRHPLALGFKSIKNSSNQIIEHYDDKNILLCTFRCAGWHYYKFTIDGTNVIVVNLIAMVFFTIFDFYALKEFFNIDLWITSESTVFILCLASIIPLAFYIGQAVASISAQTSMGLGAVINAFFSTIVEIFLYCVALQQKKGLLVEGSMIGSILGAVLLLPGLSMCGGALNRKTQRYNPRSAGVSSALLIFSMIVMFVPTLLYMMYSGYDVICDDLDATLPLDFYSAYKVMSTSKCHFSHPPLKFDKLYTHVIEPMSIVCAFVLFLAYTIGLWFTLRTHAATIWQLPIADPPREIVNTEANGIDGILSHEEDHNDEGGGHDAPNWSRSKSTLILLLATLLYAIIAEILVSCVDSVLEDFPSLSPKFLGLTIFALVPNTTEFLNAISFAMHGNIALSMEIGSAYALQVCLLQIPALVLFSVITAIGVDKALISIRDQMFPLVFPTWDLVASMASIFVFTYLYAEGKSNYFKGSILILLYVIIIMGFYYQGLIAEWGIIT